MGRTLATATQVVDQEIESWRQFRRALRKEDQTALDELFADARLHTAESAYVSRVVPFETVLLCMLIEQQKRNREQQEQIRELNERLARLEEHHEH